MRSIRDHLLTHCTYTVLYEFDIDLALRELGWVLSVGVREESKVSDQQEHRREREQDDS